MTGELGTGITSHKDSGIQCGVDYAEHNEKNQILHLITQLIVLLFNHYTNY